MIPQPQNCGMIAIMSAKEMFKAVQKVKREKMGKLPIFNYARIALTKDGMQITTSDGGKTKSVFLDYSYSGRLKRWATCVPMITRHEVENDDKSRRSGWHHSRPFPDFLKVMAQYNDTLYLDFDPGREILIVTAGNSRTEFKCMNAKEFPPVK